VANFALHNSELPAITRKAPLNQDNVQILIDFLDMFYMAAFVGGVAAGSMAAMNAVSRLLNNLSIRRFYSLDGHSAVLPLRILEIDLPLHLFGLAVEGDSDWIHVTSWLRFVLEMAVAVLTAHQGCAVPI